MNPPLGTFIRPVGKNWCYCFELVKVVPTEKGGHQWHLKRWGMKNKQPINDGHNNISYIQDLTEVLPGVWRQPQKFDDWDLDPLYYRRIDTRGQISLF